MKYIYNIKSSQFIIDDKVLSTHINVMEMEELVELNMMYKSNKITYYVEKHEYGHVNPYALIITRNKFKMFP